MSNEQKKCLTDGSPVTEDHRELKDNGQQKGYVVLAKEERAKGFVRPVRCSYIHAGITPKNPLRDLTEEEKIRYAEYDYVKYEKYLNNDNGDSAVGRFWTQKKLGSGCGSLTTMARPLAETYARIPGFYGATFCCGCGKHFPVDEFVWDGTSEVVGA